MGIYSQAITEEQFFAKQPAPIEEKTDETPWYKEVSAGARLNVYGYAKFMDMVDRKKMMPSNEGDDSFFETPEFQELTKDIPAEDIEPFMEAKNAEYLKGQIQNYNNRKEAEDIIEKAGVRGMALEVVTSLADIPSWVVGGGIFKGFKLADTALNIGAKSAVALKALEGGVSASTAIGVSEYLIQQGSSINDTQRLKDMVIYGGVFGGALPLIPTIIKGTSIGASRAISATGINNIVRNANNPQSIWRFLGESSAQGAKTDGAQYSERLYNIGDKAVTPVKAKRDADGNFIAHTENTAMDVKQETYDNGVIEIEQQIHMRSKANRVANEDQAYNDGVLKNKETNQNEQIIGKEIGELSDEQLLKEYEQATGIKIEGEFPADIYRVVMDKRMREAFDSGRFKENTSVQYITNFFKRFGERATKARLGGVSGKDSRNYWHIKYNHDYVASLAPSDARSKFLEMLQADKLNQALISKGKLTTKDLEDQADHLVKIALDTDLARKFMDNKGTGATSALKQRTLRMDRSLYPEMFVNDIGVLANEYAEYMGGRIAMKEAYGLEASADGFQSVLDREYKAIRDEMITNGADPKTVKRGVENAKAIFESVLGIRKFAKNSDKNIPTAIRMLKKGANALYSAGFVKYGIIEPTVAIARFGIKNVLTEFIPAHARLKEQLASATPTDPLVKLIRHAGLAGQTLRGIRYDRYDNYEVVPSVSKAEMFLDKISHYARKISGFNYVNDVSDFIAGGSAMRELFDIISKNGKMTKAQASRMARYGLDEKMIKALGKENIIRHTDGSVKDYNLDNWKDQELARNTVRYLQRAVTDTIMRADGTRVHRWQSDVNNDIASMALQYTQMPFALYERLIVNGMDELSARTAVGIGMSMFMMYGILELEDTAEVTTGLKNEPASTEELLTQAVSRIPFAGILPNYIDVGLSLAGQPRLGTNFKSNDVASTFLGAGVGVANKLYKTVGGLGDGFDETDVKNISKVMPILNSLPLVKQLFQYGVKDYSTGFEIDDTAGHNPAFNYLED